MNMTQPRDFQEKCELTMMIKVDPAYYEMSDRLLIKIYILKYPSVQIYKSNVSYCHDLRLNVCDINFTIFHDNLYYAKPNQWK